MSSQMNWPDRIVVPLADFLPTVGQVVRHFGERGDSLATIVGIETDSGRFVVKHAESERSIEWLESAIRFHSAVAAPSIPPIVHRFATPSGLAIVEPWATGEVLNDVFDPTVPDRDVPGSPFQRFLGLPVPEIATALATLFDAHVSVAEAGFVAVDLYDGCLIYDFDRHRLSLIDLDLYRPGPYVLDADRQYGSTTFMAPEEWERGATIDERTTVFTLGRFALVLLGAERHGPPRREQFRGDDRLYDIAIRACAPDPADRYPSVADLHRAWTSLP